MGRDDQTTAAVQVPFHEVPLGRVERRVLLQPDLPEDRATSLKHGEVRKPLVGDPPQGMGPAIRGEPRLVRCLSLRRERRTSDHDKDVPERIGPVAVQESAVRVRRRVPEPTARGDLEEVVRICGEIRQHDRVVGDEVGGVLGEDQGGRARPVADLRGGRLVRAPTDRAARRAPVRDRDIVDRRAAREDLGARRGRMRRPSILVRRGEGVPLADLEDAVRRGRPEGRLDRAAPHLLGAAADEGHVLPGAFDPGRHMDEDRCRGGVLHGDPDRVAFGVGRAIESHPAVRRIDGARRDEGEGLRADRDVRSDHADGPVAGDRGLPDHRLLDVRHVERAVREGLGLGERREVIAAVHGPVGRGHLEVQVVHEGFRRPQGAGEVAPREDDFQRPRARDVEGVALGVPREQPRGPIDDLRSERVPEGGKREHVREEDASEPLLVVRPRVRGRARDDAGSGDRDARGDQEGPDQGGARGHRVRRQGPSRGIPAVREVLPDDRGRRRSRRGRVAGAEPLVVRLSPPAEEVPIGHRGLPVEDRDDRRFDAPVHGRAAAALRGQVVLRQARTGVRVVGAADGDDVLRRRGRADRPGRARGQAVAGGEEDRHVRMGPDERVDHPGLGVVDVVGASPAVAVDPDRRDRIVVDESGRAEEVRVILRQIAQHVRVPAASGTARGNGADVLEVELRRFGVAVVRRGPDARVIARERRGDRSPMSEGAIREPGPVVAVLDRPRIPGTSAARPGELPGEDAHVEVADDLPAGEVRGVVEIARDDCSGRLPELIAVVIQAGVRLADDLAGGIQPDVPIAVVRRGIRLDHPIRLRVPIVHVAHRVDELDRRQRGQRGDEIRGDSRSRPAEVAAPKRAEDRGPGAGGEAGRDSLVADPRLDRLRRLPREDDDADVEDPVPREVRTGFPLGRIRSRPVDGREGGDLGERGTRAPDDERVLREVPEDRQAEGLQ